jgi:alpha-1,6-mannosyltransferase
MFSTLRTMPPQAAPPIALGPVPLSVVPSVRVPSPLRVLDVTEWFGDTTGGVRRYLLEKARYVARHPGLSQVLVVPGPSSSVTDESGSRCYRLQGPVIPMQAPYRVLYQARAVDRIVARERPDVIEVGSPWAAPWIALRAARHAAIPAVWFFHGNFPTALRPAAGASALSVRARTVATDAAWWYARRIGRRFARTIVASESTARDLERAGIDRVVRVPLGVDLDTFSPSRRSAAPATRRALGLPDAPAPVVAFVGRFVLEKELELLVDAWPAIARETGATLLLVGAGPREVALRQRMARRGGSRVLWRPFESDRGRMADLLAAVDLYVAPGSTETFGLAPLEALASGTPVVSADQGGVAEQVLRSGAGAVFAAGDAADLARVVVEQLGRGDRPAIARRARGYAEREHGWDMVFDRLFSVYREVIGEVIAA